MSDCPKCQSNEHIYLGHVEGWKCVRCGGLGEGWLGWLAVVLAVLAVIGMIAMPRIARGRDKQEVAEWGKR